MNQEAMEKKEGAGLFSDLGVEGKSNNNGNNKKDDGGAGFLTGLTLMIPVKPMLALYVIISFFICYYCHILLFLDMFLCPCLK